jgi:hypothetical protein
LIALIVWVSLMPDSFWFYQCLIVVDK